jgi:hypothetical protein
MNCDFFSDLFHIQSDLAGITHGVFLLYKGIPHLGFWDTAKKAFKGYDFYGFFIVLLQQRHFHHSIIMTGSKKERELYQAMRNWITSWLSAAPDRGLSGSLIS